MLRPALWLRIFGINPKRALASMRGLRRYLKNRREFRAGLGNDFQWGQPFPVLDEWDASSGELAAYFQQDLLVARWIHERKPRRHIDVGSRIDGFVGNLAVFREVEVLDIRPQDIEVTNVTFSQLDIMQDLPEQWRACTDSLSCLHSIEHFGLGRYGDTIDPSGHLKGLRQLMAIVEPGGRLYLSTPIGPQRIEFNAHRVFAAATLLGWFKEGWEIERFAVIDDANRVIESPESTPQTIAANFGCQLGVGIVAARKML
jgi:hypothetical protein